MATEFDLEGLAHGVHRLVVLDRAAVEQLELALAVRTHAVREREALADLVAVGAAPAQFDAGAADVGLVVFEGALATGTDAHGETSVEGGAAAGAATVPIGVGGTKASASAWVIGQVALPPAR